MRCPLCRSRAIHAGESRSFAPRGGARDLKEFVEVQQRYTQKQVMSYTRQAQELGRLLADAARMAQRRS